MIKATILIVEDDGILALLLQSILRRQGYAVAGPLAAGEEAIAFVASRPVDLILMDVELAGDINGINAAATIHETMDVPIIFLTGFSQDQLPNEAKDAKPYGYLGKPIVEQQLFSTVEMALQQHSLDRQLQKNRLDLARSEEKYRQLFENSPLGIFRTTLSRALAVNAEVEPFFYALARFLAEDLGMDFVCIDRLEGDGLTAQTVAVWCDGHFQDNISYALKDTPCAEVVDRQICCYPASVCKLFPNDQVLQELRAESYAGVTLLSHTGRPIGLIAIISREPMGDRRLAENILKMVAVRAAGEMERLDAEQALRASKNLLRDIATNIPGAMYQFIRHRDGSFVIPFMSEGAAQVLGQPLEVLQDAGRLFTNVHPDDMPGLWSSISESAEAMSRWRQEFRVFFPTGETRWLQGTSQPSHTDDGGICWNGVILDITERKEAEDERKKLQSQLQQAQKMEAIGTLAGGIAHDFNNILGAVLGYAEMARDDCPAGSQVARDLDQVIKASHRAKDLVKQILAFSRQADNAPIAVQPAIIIKESLKMLRSSLPSTIAIHQDLAADTGPILADPTQIHQIIMNLCTNAFHAMEESGGILSVLLETRRLGESDLTDHLLSKPGDFIHIAIGDTGQGIAPEIRDKIFDPFFTTKEIGKGTGMGLSIVHGIVKSYGGFVSCDSQLGKGTVFHITLPVLPADHALPQTETVEIIPIGSERILFVDDEPMLSEKGQSMLQRLGYHVTIRRSRLEALSSFQNQPKAYDLVITDQTMPGMTGIDMARRMLQIRPDLPIILCTGYSSLISEDKALAMGIKGFALKPLAKKDIAMLIRKVLDKRR
jgi:PAS domain S-box-containing protein